MSSDKAWCYITVFPGLQAKIDQEDFDRASRHKWRMVRPRKGRPRVVTSIKTPDGTRQLTLSRFIMNPPEDMMVYARRFNDELDYRKSNLVVCTMQERQTMLPKNRKVGSSIYKGVSYSKADQLWTASLRVKGRYVYIGQYASEDEAAEAYNKAARDHFGPRAYQNQVGRKDHKRNSDAA